MQLAEREAVQRGCHGAWLDTFEFQARGFYERLGYTCFGELPNYPAGCFLGKPLVAILVASKCRSELLCFPLGAVKGIAGGKRR